MDHPRDPRAVDWLESTQQPSGGWGETCRSYDDPSLKGTGEPTPSQTAWATLGLIAAGRASRDGRAPRDRLPARDPAPRRLLGRAAVHRHRIPPGVLPAVPSTTGSIFPLMAIARYQAAIGSTARPIEPGAWPAGSRPSRWRLTDGR